MKSSLVMNFSVDKKDRKIKVEREFAASLSDVWAAWTKSELLDQWWAPKPWKAKTRSMDFREGGHWLYAMVGPNGEQHWARSDFQTIDPEKSFTARDAFCDENGNVDTSSPRSTWTNTFSGGSGTTTVNIEIQVDSVADLEKYLEMGFKEGFLAALENLDEVLE